MGRHAMTADRLTIALVYPALLGTYGDRGNAAILAARARRRGIDAEIIDVAPDQAVPELADLYVVGGGEDEAQIAAARTLATSGVLGRAHDAGRPILAICAGLQILGTSFADGAGQAVAGVGLIDATTLVRLPTRAVGELLVDAEPSLGIGLLTGYENHGGATRLGPGLRPLGRVLAGVGNGDGGVDGVVDGHLIGSYLHGPALARNPALADLLLRWATGLELAPLPDVFETALRAERLSAVRGPVRD